MMTHQSSSLEVPGPTQSSNIGDKDQLRLDPGAPERKPRSVVKCCLLTTFTIVFFVICWLLYLALKGAWYGLQHPHSKLYYDKPATEITDWSKVVRPMISERDSFDIVASVWVQDVEGKHGGLYIDGKERPERLLFSDTVFRNLHLGDKLQHANVSLRVPTSHFKQVNISNYDLRASFVVVQRYQPQWLDGAKNLHSWKPESLRSPNMRFWAEPPSFQDEIYDNFGITIPLIQFHNMQQTTPTEDIRAESENTAFYARSDDDLDVMPEGDDTDLEVEEKGQTKNNFALDFSGNYPMPVAENHPYIVTRTYLGIFKDTNIYNRNAYVSAQKELANRTCIDPKTKNPFENPRWYQCIRTYATRGVLETRVQVSSNRQESNRQMKWENLYAPHLGALMHAPGPKDLIPVPVDREGPSSRLSLDTLDEDFVNVTWKLSFSGHSRARGALLALTGRPDKYNMTAPENELLLKQHEHEASIGLFGYRSHEDAHPRRVRILDVLFWVTHIPTWFLAIHYWYTRTSTIGISRFGTALIVSSLVLKGIEDFLIKVLDPETTAIWPVALIFHMIASIDFLVMLKAVLRLEFGSSGKKVGKKRWFTKIYIAKATHAERASARIEARMPMRLKLQLLLALFVIIYYFELAYLYLISPLVVPTSTGHDTLLSIHAYAPASLKILHALGLTNEIGGEILQLIMNAQSRTYAGKYKATATLLFIGSLARMLDMVPMVVGQSTRSNGFGIWEGSFFVLSFVNIVQAMKYRSAKSSDIDETED